MVLPPLLHAPLLVVPGVVAQPDNAGLCSGSEGEENSSSTGVRFHFIPTVLMLLKHNQCVDLSGKSFEVSFTPTTALGALDCKQTA